MTTIPFPIDLNRKLTFEQCVSVSRNSDPVSGMLVFYDKEDNVCIYNFGDLPRKDALWLGESVKRHAMGDEL